MTKQEQIQADHDGIAPALASAQLQMGRALKNSKNPHFKSTYADLAAVIEACREALATNGIAFIQQVIDSHVKTVFLHSSGETLECLIPIIVQKEDMQGLGSAITYARRYGLMALAGISPEDDDGNAAVVAKPRYITADQVSEITDLAKTADLDLSVICAGFKISSINFLEDKHLAKVRQRLTVLAQKEPELEGAS